MPLTSGARYQLGGLEFAVLSDGTFRYDAGAVYVFVGPRTGLGRPGRQLGRPVQRLVHHDDHMHVRFPKGA